MCICKQACAVVGIEVPLSCNEIPLAAEPLLYVLHDVHPISRHCCVWYTFLRSHIYGRNGWNTLVLTAQLSPISRLRRTPAKLSRPVSKPRGLSTLMEVVFSCTVAIVSHTLAELCSQAKQWWRGGWRRPSAPRTTCRHPNAAACVSGASDLQYMDIGVIRVDSCCEKKALPGATRFRTCWT